MITKEFTVRNRSGLESKPAAMFIQRTSSYKSSIWIEKEERKTNAKSLLGLLSLSIGQGAKVILTIDGEDEEQAAAELEEYLNYGMDEDV